MYGEIADTLAEREKSYGDYSGVARTSQTLKLFYRATEHWDSLNCQQRESLDMIASKIARILNGNPHHKDSWHDIAGYAKLAEDACTEK